MILTREFITGRRRGVSSIRSPRTDYLGQVLPSALSQPPRRFANDASRQRNCCGLHQFAKLRNISGETLAKALAKHPEVYSDARRCAAGLDGVRRRLAIAIGKLGEIYPEAKYPPVTILIGRDSTAGTTSEAGVLIGLDDPSIHDDLCAAVETEKETKATEEFRSEQVPVLLTERIPLTVFGLSRISRNHFQHQGRDEMPQLRGLPHAQSGPVAKLPVDKQTLTFNDAKAGPVSITIIRPQGITGT